MIPVFVKLVVVVEENDEVRCQLGPVCRSFSRRVSDSCLNNYYLVFTRMLLPLTHLLR